MTEVSLIDTLNVNVITENIFLGGYDAAFSKEFIQTYKIGGILNCTDNIKSRCDRSVKLKQIPLTDGESDTLSFSSIFSAITFIESILVSQDKILIHCLAGRSRSASILCGYLMWKNKWSMTKSLAFIKNRRPEADPDENYLKQLKLFEKHISIQ